MDGRDVKTAAEMLAEKPEVKPEVTQAAPTPASAEPSAAQTKPQGESVSEVDTNDEQQDLKGLRFAITQVRADRRRLKEENEKLQHRLQSMESQFQTHTPQPTAQVGTQTDPFAQVLRDEENRLREIARQEITAKTVEEEKEIAANHILSQKDVTSDADVKAIGQIIVDYGLDASVGKVGALKVAEAALQLWRDTFKRNVDPRLKAEATALPASSSNGTGGGKRVWSREEISTLDQAEYLKHRDDILAADREGRIK